MSLAFGSAPLCEQRFDDVRHRLLNGRMQRRAAGAAQIRVGAAIEQERGHLGMLAVDRDEQRRRIGVGLERPSGVGVAGNAVGRRVVDVGARVEQQAGDRDVALLGREEQRGEPVLRSRRHVGSRLDQRSNDLDVILGDRPHQRRLSLRRFARRHIGAGRQQQLHELHVAGVGRRHQRRFANDRGQVRIGAGFEQRGRHPRAAIETGERQRRNAVVVRGVHVGARGQQEIGHLQVIPVRRPMQRRRTVAERCVHVCLLSDERAHGREILGFGRVGDSDDPRPHPQERPATRRRRFLRTPWRVIIIANTDRTVG